MYKRKCAFLCIYYIITWWNELNLFRFRVRANDALFVVVWFTCKWSEQNNKIIKTQQLLLILHLFTYLFVHSTKIMYICVYQEIIWMNSVFIVYMLMSRYLKYFNRKILSNDESVVHQCVSTQSDSQSFNPACYKVFDLKRSLF